MSQAKVTYGIKAETTRGTLASGDFTEMTLLSASDEGYGEQGEATPTASATGEKGQASFSGTGAAKLTFMTVLNDSDALHSLIAGFCGEVVGSPQTFTGSVTITASTRTFAATGIETGWAVGDWFMLKAGRPGVYQIATLGTNSLTVTAASASAWSLTDLPATSLTISYQDQSRPTDALKTWSIVKWNAKAGHGRLFLGCQVEKVGFKTTTADPARVEVDITFLVINPAGIPPAKITSLPDAIVAESGLLPSITTVDVFRSGFIADAALHEVTTTEISWEATLGLGSEKGVGMAAPSTGGSSVYDSTGSMTMVAEGPGFGTFDALSRDRLPHPISLILASPRAGHGYVIDNPAAVITETSETGKDSTSPASAAKTFGLSGATSGTSPQFLIWRL